MLVVGDVAVSKDEPCATNEPNDAGKNATNEAKLASESYGAQTTDHGQLTTDIPEEVESYEQGVSRRKAAREEFTRKLNEEARKEAEATMAIRRARISEQKQRNAKPRNQPQREGIAAFPARAAIRKSPRGK